VCAICGQEYSKNAIVTAHKKKRSVCTEAEKRDPYIVFPVCSFGCDYLYERGFVSVKDDEVISGHPAGGPTEEELVKTLVGRRLNARWTEGPSSYFERDIAGDVTEQQISGVADNLSTK